MEKLDLTKKYRSHFTAKTTPQLVDIGKSHFISITGKGDPSGKPFADRIEALYSTAYFIKFIYKDKDKDFVVSKLEGLWWYDDEKFTDMTIETAPTEIPRSEWEYRLLIRIPEFVKQPDITSATASVFEKKKIELVSHVEYFEMSEGRCVQMLHVGPFSTEPMSLQKLDAFMKTNNFAKNGLHHEIYLSDFRKTAPEKLKTILREPVK